MTARETNPDRRKGRRALLLGCLGLYLVPELLFVAYLGWANSLPPPEPHQRVYPQPNGYDATIAAAMKLSTPARGSRRWSPLSATSTAQLRRTLKSLDAERPALEELRKAIRLEYLNPPIRSMATLLPHLAHYREAARRFAAESRVALADGRPGKAAQRALDAMELGSRVGRGGPTIHGILGTACSAIGSSALEPVVPGLSATEARAAGTRLDRIMRQFPTEREVFEEERKASLFGLREVFAGEIDPTQLSGGGSSGTTPPVRRVLGFLYPKRWAYSTLDRSFRQLIDETGKPFVERRRFQPPQDPIADMVAPEMDQATLIFARNGAVLALFRAALALEVYRGRHGRYPETLDALVPRVLGRVPADPFTGKPLRYRRQADGYLLYSVGPDGQGNGGRPVFANKVKQGVTGDLVFGQLFARTQRAKPPRTWGTAAGKGARR